MRSGGGNSGASATGGVANGGAGGGMDVGRVGMALAGMVGAGFGGLAVVGMASHREYLLEWVVAASDGRRMGASSLAPRRARRGVRAAGSKAGETLSGNGLASAGRLQRCAGRLRRGRGVRAPAVNARRRHSPSRFGLHPAIGGERTERRAAPYWGLTAGYR